MTSSATNFLDSGETRPLYRLSTGEDISCCKTAAGASQPGFLIVATPYVCPVSQSDRKGTA